MHASRQPVLRGTAFALRDPWPWPTFAQLSRDGEDLGYRAIFLPEIAGRDALAALTALAGETERIALATGIVPITSRGTPLTAMAAATVQERSGGRAVLGLGAGRPRRGALDELEAAVAELRSAFADAASGSPGDGVLAVDRPVPIWVAALGPKAVRLAGRVADGVLLNWCSPDRVAEARRQVAEGAEEAGRDADQVTIAAYVRAAVGERSTETDARAALGAAAAEYAAYPAYRRQFEAMGVGEAASALAAGGAAETAGSPLVAAVCLAGDPHRARARLDEYRAAGCDLPVVYPVPFGDDGAGSVDATLRSLSPEPWAP